MPSRTWTHPTLGTFTLDDNSNYSAIHDMPAFKAFSYDTGYDNAPRSTGKHTLSFSSGGLDDMPSPEAAQLAATLLADQKSLVDKIANALWEEFNGRGPTCHYWWYGDLDQVNEMLAGNDFPPVKGPKDIYPLLQLDSIEIAKRAYPDTPEWDTTPTLAELRFHSAFEEEHGLCVMTDGTNLLGISYSTDNAMYEDDNEDKD